MSLIGTLLPTFGTSVLWFIIDSKTRRKIVWKINRSQTNNKGNDEKSSVFWQHFRNFQKKLLEVYVQINFPLSLRGFPLKSEAIARPFKSINDLNPLKWPRPFDTSTWKHRFNLKDKALVKANFMALGTDATVAWVDVEGSKVAEATTADHKVANDNRHEPGLRAGVWKQPGHLHSHVIILCKNTSHRYSKLREKRREKIQCKQTVAKLTAKCQGHQPPRTIFGRNSPQTLWIIGLFFLTNSSNISVRRPAQGPSVTLEELLCGPELKYGFL